MGRVAVGHHIDIGINVCKTPADDVALSWRQFGSNYRASSTSYIHGIISRIVVEDINDSVRQSRTKCCYRGADGRLFIATRKDYRHTLLRHSLTIEPAVCAQPTVNRSVRGPVQASPRKRRLDRVADRVRYTPTSRLFSGSPRLRIRAISGSCFACYLAVWVGRAAWRAHAAVSSCRKKLRKRRLSCTGVFYFYARA